mmetsp:Transcript_2697/g.5799  ORF Transcript_2697/g.5799 Transcript_2697/m.5799 type:complete len:81 (+) Transcript_2697:764-1006(+)
MRFDLTKRKSSGVVESRRKKIDTIKRVPIDMLRYFCGGSVSVGRCSVLPTGWIMRQILWNVFSALVARFYRSIVAQKTQQ